MAGGRTPVVAGTGSNSTDEAVQMTQHAEKAGAAASLQVAPYYNRPSQEGLFRHFTHIADSTGLPIVLYNIPGRCGVEISVETMARLAEHPRIVAVKEATGRVEATTQIRRKTGLEVLAGDDALALPIIALGGTGVVSVLSNLFPARMTRLVAAALAGDLPSAQREHDDLFPLMKALFLETNPVPVKTALAAMGRLAEEFRLPLVPMEPATKQELLAALAGFL
jgi:4-hydroxy-tetrahydrodipicolinate synthase